ncbi:glycosyltransferase family 2 protein [Paraburkholderia sp. MMS20-SJTR3]|uniref:Glycosyltransferase family 2 protein n=1 Tax=Paraburkholderia sejongensis TaxID=2886946 RepID=A0ABS8JTE6_9BURK|nr:glycosyltransferase family 2 protein [Paraburkholderia sp. MMS20-SJTR3]MCC8393179.1 glycosyltransferase family 2 protein [Paraburkholderia sp. MMS20-SJTR3]
MKVRYNESLAERDRLFFSVVIANYNYGRFVRQAIDSALAQDWPNREVIVVDDGSTDDSAEVIRSYGEKITAIFKKNGGQREANNVGFERSAGDVVIFLDADDVLVPGALRSIASVWRPGLSKVQVLMERVDAQGRPLHSAIPKLRNVIPNVPPKLSSEAIRNWAYRIAEYPTPPGSGNAYARTFLERIFPLGENYDSFTDSTCIAMAPYMGDVETIAAPLVLYRMHGANDSAMSANVSNFGREITRALKRHNAACEACEMMGLPPPPLSTLFSAPHLLQLRVASLRLTPDQHPLPGDSRIRALRDALSIPFRESFERPAFRILIAGWSVATLIAPKDIASKLIRRRFI